MDYVAIPPRRREPHHRDRHHPYKGAPHSLSLSSTLSNLEIGTWNFSGCWMLDVKAFHHCAFPFLYVHDSLCSVFRVDPSYCPFWSSLERRRKLSTSCRTCDCTSGDAFFAASFKLTARDESFCAASCHLPASASVSA